MTDQMNRRDFIKYAGITGITSAAMLANAKKAMADTVITDEYVAIDGKKYTDAATVVVGRSGAVDYLCDGTADDVQIQAAIDYVSGLGGGTVLVREGTYVLTTPIEIHSNINMIGVGYNCRIQNQKAGGGTDNGNGGSAISLFNSCIINSDRVLGNTNIHIKNIVFDGYKTNKTNGFCHCIQFIGVTKSSVNNCIIHSSKGDGLELSYAGLVGAPVICEDIICTDSIIYGGERNGISAIYLTGGLFKNNIIYEYERGIDCEGAQVEDVNIIGNNIRTITYAGIQASLPSSGGAGIFRNINISNNIIKDCISNTSLYSNKAFGIYVQKIDSGGVYEDILISNNIIETVTGNVADVAEGIKIESIPDRCIVSDNIIYNIDGIGLNLASHNVQANNNLVDTCSTQGINIDQDNVKVTNNVVKNITGHGAWLYFVTNVYMANNVFENITGNVLNFTGGTTPTIIDNFGYNPVGNFAAPSVPASTVNYTNSYGYPCQVQITGGTVTEIDIDDIATGLTSGVFIIPPGGTINITYSVAPTWRWWGL